MQLPDGALEGDQTVVAVRRGPSLVCVLVVPDGLSCGDTWPTCVNESRCIQQDGCFWRAWHGIQHDKMRRK